MTSATEHKLIGGTLVADRDGVRAHCTCGWVSRPCFSSMVCSCVWDDHVTEATGKEVVRNPLGRDSI